MSESPAANSQSPSGAPEELIGFTDGRTVDVREIDEKRWLVLRPFSYQAKRELFTVPEGERTDFASVPRPFVWFIPTYGRYTKAAILHDHLCRLALESKISRRDADGIFRQAMRTSGVAFLRRWIMWAAVRWGAVITPVGRQGWLRDAWLVILTSLFVAPFVLPAATVIVLTLLAWYLTELIAWVPLTLVRRTQTRTLEPPKRVNMPELTFRL
jgi:hypothetical protein